MKQEIEVIKNDTFAVYYDFQFSFADLHLPVAVLRPEILEKAKNGEIVGFYRNDFGEIKAELKNGQILRDCDILLPQRNV